MPTSKELRAARLRPLLTTGLAVASILALWLLHWVHLRADFPNDSPWMDYAKYTDEGWYGNAAIRAVLFGHWYFAGDFNPAVALPVWPALEWVAFRIGGVRLEVARGLSLLVFAGNLWLSFALMRVAGVCRRDALGGVLFLAGSVYLWAFSRLAILEPLLTFWTLAGWLVAMRLKARSGPARFRRLLLVGLLACLAVLTKTTALFLLPATAAIVCWAAGWRAGAAARNLAIACAGGAVPWLAYFLGLARRRSLDFHYLFAANRWVQPKGLHDRLLAFWWAAHGLLWVGPPLVCTALVLLALGLWFRSFRNSPLVQASLLASAGYIGFTGWHNSPQPRYYMVLIYPVVFVTILALAQLRTRSRLLAGVGGGILVLLFAQGVWESIYFARHPQYTLLEAARGLTGYIDAHPSDGRRMLLSISGDEITLMTHLPAICDDFGTDDLPDRIARYRPGWYAQWNELDPGTLEDIHAAGYDLRAVAHWHALDDEDRDDLVLYHMDPAKAKETP